MSFQNDYEFFKELHALLTKHGVAMITSANSTKFLESTKDLEGFNAFFTRGDKNSNIKLNTALITLIPSSLEEDKIKNIKGES